MRKTRLGVHNFGPQFYDQVEQRELQEVLDGKNPFRWSAGGRSKVLQFERRYATHLGAKYALGVTSGTTALFTAVAALGIGPGDEVILPAWTWYACYDAIVLCGALPVFAEIDESFDIDPRDIEAKITPRTKAVMPVHLQGCPCDMDPILEIARAHKLRVLEDCAVRGRALQGEIRGHDGRPGHLQLPAEQDDHFGRGRGGGQQRSPLVRAGLPLPRRGPPALALHRGPGRRTTGRLRRVQLPHERVHRRGAVRAAREAGDHLHRPAPRRPKGAPGIADLPGLKLRKSPDLEGELGVGVFLDLGTPGRRDRFLGALAAEGISAAPPGGSAILPIDPRIEKKATIHPAWPSFQTPAGKAIRYGRQCCPRTIDILGRHAGVMLDPTFRDDDLQDIIRAVRKVYLALHRHEKWTTSLRPDWKTAGRPCRGTCRIRSPAPLPVRPP